MINKGDQAWLQSSPVPYSKENAVGADMLNQIVLLQKELGPAMATAVQELQEGIYAITGRMPQLLQEEKSVAVAQQSCLAVGIINEHPIFTGALPKGRTLQGDGYILKTITHGKQRLLLLGGMSERAVLYGAFHLLRQLRLGSPIHELQLVEEPSFQVRMLNHWDNIDGSVERGYAGKSIFFKDNIVLWHSPRIKQYARLLSSVGINAIAINNVNVHQQETLLITHHYLHDVAKLADTFRSCGIQLYLSVNFAAPYELGELPTADPLDEEVQRWWREKAADIYEAIPDFGGFVVKADSENRPGPFTYNRDHADGANMLAAALKPYGGVVFWRCFVYDCHQDWRDRSTDRAKAAYDHFKPLDGKFMDNVILQVKNGPMDFQVREPVSPLFGAMADTNQVMEFQITQEYTGQQRHVCYLIPQWKQVLDFDTHLQGEGTTVARLAAGLVHKHHRYSGVTAVSNIGDDSNWTGHHLAQANLYGYGRLMWNPELSAEAIASEWTRLTFGHDEQAASVIVDWLMGSWLAYEKYTSPLGIGWMVTPHYHYGPDVDGYEYSKWGTYHFADWKGIGVDRTMRSGTGYTAQYAEPNATLYEDVNTCPDELLLFFHHVPYTHRLHSGKTVIQHIYDTHFEGVEQVEQWRERWLQLAGHVDEKCYFHVLERLEHQLEHAELWRDVINTYFYRKSGIADERGRKMY